MNDEDNSDAAFINEDEIRWRFSVRVEYSLILMSVNRFEIHFVVFMIRAFLFIGVENATKNQALMPCGQRGNLLVD